MNSNDTRVLLKKEYNKNKRTTSTGCFLIGISVFCYLLFFLYVQELMLIGTGILFDIAAVSYLLKALKGTHPFWEMQLALALQKQPTPQNLDRLCGSLEIAREERLPAFSSRAKEIFAETLTLCRSRRDIPAEDIARLEQLLADLG